MIELVTGKSQIDGKTVETSLSILNQVCSIKLKIKTVVRYIVIVSNMSEGKLNEKKNHLINGQRKRK